MSVNSGSLGINPVSCSPNQQQTNWRNAINALQNLQQQLGDPTSIPPAIASPAGISGALQNLQQQLQNFIAGGGGGGGSDKFVAVKSGDTPDYLEAQLADNRTGAGVLYSSANDIIVYNDSALFTADYKIRNYIDADTISGWDNSHEYALGWNASGGPEAKTWGQVKWDAGDVADFMENQLVNSAVYDSNEDAIVCFDTATAHAGLLFWDASAIFGYDATKYQALTHDTSGKLQWSTIANTTVVASISAPTGTFVATVTPTTATGVLDVSWDTSTCVMTKTTGTVVTGVSSTNGTAVTSVTPTNATVKGLP